MTSQTKHEHKTDVHKQEQIQKYDGTMQNKIQIVNIQD